MKIQVLLVLYLCCAQAQLQIHYNIMHAVRYVLNYMLRYDVDVFTFGCEM
jgi:hypothetical protein